MTATTHHRPTLVLGGTGKTGRRLVERLTSRHLPVRIGRNIAVGDGVERVLGRPPRDFTEYSTATAATGVWAPTS